MLGHKAREFKQHTSISLEDLVPADNFYRQVERRIDLSFVRKLASEFYANMGRPSIDPVVFFKLQLIAFFEGIRSERQLMETVNLNLAHRWFIGYDLDEPVPEAASPGTAVEPIWSIRSARLPSAEPRSRPIVASSS